jgi:NADPH-dependent 2,4-dienoyl-CoA reductase/sulfur reductase-like enzyme
MSFMKYPMISIVVLGGLLVGHSCFATDGTHHEVDVCVYGGTASGVMAALAAAKEGAEVMVVEPSRWLGGMTGGGINHLDWGKGNAVGGSTYKILLDGLEKQVRGHDGNAVFGAGHQVYRERFKKALKDRGIAVIYEHRLGKVDVGGKMIDAPTRQQPIALNDPVDHPR